MMQTLDELDTIGKVPSLNMDFARKIMSETAAQAWVASPSPTVWLERLAREAAEHGHPRRIVRSCPDSFFPELIHPLGEETLVLKSR